MPGFIKSRPFAALVAAAGLFAFSAPSLAASEGQALKVKTVEKNGQTLYCIKQDAMTGSIVAKTRCLTKDDWAKNGVALGKTEDKKDGALAANPEPNNHN
jgi:predicted lipoprotein with Yx(FWY)xxD motif